MQSAFWDDHQADLADPEYARAFAAESIRIATLDAVVNRIAEGAKSAKMSKAALARSIGADPAVVRRLLTSDHANPTLGTLSEVAAALGMKVTLEPMTAAERRRFTEPMTRHANAPQAKDRREPVGSAKSSHRLASR